jgi:thymidylate synthase
MFNYHQLLEDILKNGEKTNDRTGVGTISVFGRMLRWDLSKGFPAVTTKRLAWNAVVGELLWFLEGSTNVNRLREITHGPGSDKQTIWDANYSNQGIALGYENGELGPIYGQQWRNFGNVDQMTNLINGLQKDMQTGSRGRRHLVSAWNVPELNKMSLMPCHYSFQCHLSQDGHLNLLWNQRSVDSLLGLAFNIASYALLTHILASIVGAKPGELIFSGGDCHIYLNHIDQVNEQLSREERPMPVLRMPIISSLDDLRTLSPKDFILEGYKPHPSIKAPMAV